VPMDLQVGLIALQVLVVVALMVFVAGAVYRAATDRVIDGTARIVWVTGILLFPAVGALAWFAWGWLGRPGSNTIASSDHLTYRN
jgi:hypothetical protein